MREDDIEIIYKNLHLDFVNKYFKNKKQQQKIHKNHNEWYKTHISSFDYSIYVFEDDKNNFVAMTSYEILIDTAKVNIYLSKDYRNKKYSQEILSESINKFLSDNKNIKYLQAYILEENFASKKLFENNERAIKLYEKFGFKLEGCIEDGIFDGEKYINLLVYGLKI